MRLPMRVNLRGCDGNFGICSPVPEGLTESSPAIYCWVIVKRGGSVPEGRLKNRTSADCLVGSTEIRSSLAGRIALKKPNPALKCWATFSQSLRDRRANPKLSQQALKLTRMGVCRTRLPSPLLGSAVARSPLSRSKVCSFFPIFFERVVRAWRFFLAQFVDQSTGDIG
jgi:hypothetical protein